MEREQGSQHTKADEDEGEEDVLDPTRDGVVSSDRGQFERVVTTVLAIEEVDTQQTKNQRADPPISMSVSFMAEYSLWPEPQTPIKRYIGIRATS